MKIFYWMPAYNMTAAARTRSQAVIDGGEAERYGHTLIAREDHSCDLVRMRNAVLDQLVKRPDFDYLFMQDSDVYSVPSEGGGPLMRLLSVAQETGAAMTGALVMLRTRPPLGNTHPCRPGEVCEVEKMGTGMVLINLEKVREWYAGFRGPCFARSYKRYDVGDGELDNRMAVAETGLDIWFCKVVRGHGQSIWCDGRIPTVHQDGTRTITFDGKQGAFMDTADSADSEGPDCGVIAGLEATGAKSEANS